MNEPHGNSTHFEELLALGIEAERLEVRLDLAALRQRFPSEAAELIEFLGDHAAMRKLAGSPTPEGRTEPPRDNHGGLQLGRYRLIEEIGRGGMGAVHKAWQEGVNRVVAVKIISAGPFASTEEIRRFQLEAEAAAGLSHPGLVPIYESDICDGRPYYSMEYVAGRTLSEAASQDGWSIDHLAAVIAQVAEAVDYAHSQGIIHRDLKPANILVDQSGIPRVTDFGLAKRFSPDEPCPPQESSGAAGPMAEPAQTVPPSMRTRTGAILGTPTYMAPEQAAGSTEIGPPADIYSLGAILYERLTGTPPFRATSPVETLALIQEGRLEKISSRNPNVSSDLATIVETCLERDPRDRYRTASDLAEDLRRYVAGEPIQARALSLWGRAARAVGQSRHVSHFRNWGQTIIGFGVTIFVAHLIMQSLFSSGMNSWPAVYLPRVAMFAVLLFFLRASRSGSLLPRDAVERLVWVVWTAYLLAYVAATMVSVVSGGAATSIYQFAAVLAGMAFFTLGCHVWGACYLVGLAFFVAAPLLAVFPEFSALGFGSLWGISLTTLGLRYLWLNRVLPKE